MRQSMVRSLRDRWLSLLPVAIIFAAVVTLVPFLLPARHDNLSESYEPTKTLRFFYLHGHQMHKWGPMPGFVYAPFYAALLAIDKLTGHLGRVSSQYPFGFDDPLQELGAMIFAARVATMLVGLAAIYCLTRTLQRALKQSVGPVLAVFLSLSTSIIFLESLADTKPDGLMVGFLIFALANYAAIVLEGFTVARAVGLAFFYIASVSCKELTSVTLLVPYFALIVASVLRIRREPEAGKQDLRLIAVSCAAAVVFYLLINVIYAPHTWLERLTIVFGPLKDPSIWAGVHQTRLRYIMDSLWAVIGAIGWGGVLVFILSAIGSVAAPSWRLFLLWLPFWSHVILTVASAGYMPAYFMIPLGPALCLPSAYILCGQIERSGISHRRLTMITAGVAACCLWIAFCAVGLFRATHPSSMIQAELKEDIPSGAVVNVVGLYPAEGEPVTPGPRGTSIDHRPLIQIMNAAPADRPQYLLVSANMAEWAGEIQARPARAAMIKRETGFDYSGFSGFSGLDYLPAGTISPKLPPWCSRYVVADSDTYIDNHLLVYRLRSKAGQGASASSVTANDAGNH